MATMKKQQQYKRNENDNDNGYTTAPPTYIAQQICICQTTQEQNYNTLTKTTT